MARPIDRREASGKLRSHEERVAVVLVDTAPGGRLAGFRVAADGFHQFIEPAAVGDKHGVGRILVERFLPAGLHAIEIDTLVECPVRIGGLVAAVDADFYVGVKLPRNERAPARAPALAGTGSRLRGPGGPEGSLFAVCGLECGLSYGQCEGDFPVGVHGL